MTLLFTYETLSFLQRTMHTRKANGSVCLARMTVYIMYIELRLTDPLPLPDCKFADNRECKLIPVCWILVIGRAKTEAAKSTTPDQDGNVSPPYNTAKDRGSIKRRRKGREGEGRRRKDIVLDDEDERAEEEEKEKMVIGVDRDNAFTEGERRHFFSPASLTDLAGQEEFRKVHTAIDAHVNYLISSFKRKKSTKIDFAFMSTPTNLRPRAEDDNVPDWNKWDPNLPVNFFNAMKFLLADDGYAAVLCSGSDFEQSARSV